MIPRQSFLIAPGLSVFYSKIGKMISTWLCRSDKMHVAYSTYSICSINGPSSAVDEISFSATSDPSPSPYYSVPIFLQESPLVHSVCVAQAELTSPLASGNGIRPSRHGPSPCSIPFATVGCSGWVLQTECWGPHQVIG